MKTTTKQIPITWEYEGAFCAARFVKNSRKKRRCTGCYASIPVGGASWRVFSPGASYSVCEKCWDHFENCDECREEQAEWEHVAECRLRTTSSTERLEVLGMPVKVVEAEVGFTGIAILDAHTGVLTL